MVKVSSKNPKKVPLAAELFEFGVTWMLREIELAAIRRKHIKLDFEHKRVTFVLPISKNDQEGFVVKRVLQCLCDERVCRTSCPFYTSLRLVDRMVALGIDLACTSQKKSAATKAQLIADWRLLYGTKVSGHSARRTGALRYIRQGWAIAQVAYLGRWKSSVIYEYATEALESMPVNASKAFGVGEAQNHPTGLVNPPAEINREELENIRTDLMAELAALKVDQSLALRKMDAEVEAFKERDFKLGDRLPSVVQSLASKIIHYNTDMASCSPPRCWRTLCGWHYHRSDFTFVTKVDGLNMCRKCWDLAQCNRVRNGEGGGKDSKATN